MSRYGYDSDYAQGRRDFERRGYRDYERDRYASYGTPDRDYMDGYREAERAAERREEERREEEREERRQEERRREARREAEYEEERREQERQFEEEQRLAQEEAAAMEPPDPEPSAEKVLDLFDILRKKKIPVREKTNLGRILGNRKEAW